MRVRAGGAPMPVFYLYYIIAVLLSYSSVLFAYFAYAGHKFIGFRSLFLFFAALITYLGLLIFVLSFTKRLCHGCRNVFLRRQKLRGYIDGFPLACRSAAAMSLACAPLYLSLQPGFEHPTIVLVCMLSFLLEGLCFSEVLKYVNTEYYKCFVGRIAMVICTSFDLFGPTGALYTGIIVAVSAVVLFLYHYLPLDDKEEEVGRGLKAGDLVPFHVVNTTARVYSCGYCERRMAIGEEY